MKLWLDDIRLPPDDTWWHVRTAEDAMALIRTGAVEVASLDHDLGGRLANVGKDMYNYLQATGFQLVLQMQLENVYPKSSITIHSSNLQGAFNMQRVLSQFVPYQVGLAPLPPV